MHFGSIFVLATIPFLSSCGGGSSGGRRTREDGKKTSPKSQAISSDPEYENRMNLKFLNKFKININSPSTTTVKRLKDIWLDGRKVFVFGVYISGEPVPESGWIVRESVNGNCLRIEGDFPYQGGRVFITSVAIRSNMEVDAADCNEWSSESMNLLENESFKNRHEKYKKLCDSAECVTKNFLVDFSNTYQFIHPANSFMVILIIGSNRFLD